MKRLAAILLPALVAALCAPVAPGAEPSWRLEQPAPPPGTPFAIPLGTPGDLQFLGPNHGLLAVEGIDGNTSMPSGIYFYDGVEWHRLSTVCGGPGRTTRIAIASTREFWTISTPSPPRNREAAGTALCRFLDGNVVGSFSTAPSAADPFLEMTAATCLAPNDCWFAGIGCSADPEDPPGLRCPDGNRRGAFHLHWDGANLETVYAPQGRGVSDLEVHRGVLWETVRVGKTPGDRSDQVDLFEPEPQPRLIHRIAGGALSNDAFLPASTYIPSPPSLPLPQPITTGGSELLGLDSDGQQIWAVGGGATSGAAALIAPVPRPPLAVRIEGTTWKEVASPPSRPFTIGERFVDVAAVPGTSSAWAAVEPFGSAGAGAHARVARLQPDGAAEVVTLPASGPGRGTAAKVAFTGPNEGWMVTSTGWLFHFTDGTIYPRNTDPAYSGTITFRPNEAAEQFIPDTPPADDSELFAPPPIELEQAPAPAAVKRLPALLRRIKTRLRGRTLTVRFTLSRRARVQIIGRRKGRTVARTRARTMRPGRHALRLRLTPKRWPQRLSFRVSEQGQDGAEPPASDGDTITTDGDTIATRAGR